MIRSNRKNQPTSKHKSKKSRSTPQETEYRLLITPHLNERRQEPTTLVVLETTKSFATFRYELSVEERVAGKSLSFKILGLKAPQLSLPSAGHAEFVKEYDGLNGTYEISIEGLDGTVTSFTLRISPTHVHVLKSAPQRAVELITDRSVWHGTN